MFQTLVTEPQSHRATEPQSRDLSAASPHARVPEKWSQSRRAAKQICRRLRRTRVFQRRERQTAKPPRSDQKRSWLAASPHSRVFRELNAETQRRRVRIKRESWLAASQESRFLRGEAPKKFSSDPTLAAWRFGVHSPATQRLCERTNTRGAAHERREAPKRSSALRLCGFATRSLEHAASAAERFWRMSQLSRASW